MKVLLLFLLLICMFIACKKHDDSPQNTSVLNFDTSSVKTNISEHLQALYFIDGRTGFSEEQVVEFIKQPIQQKAGQH